MNIEQEILKLENNIKEMTSYLLMKVNVADWHAVADAAMDIREFQAKIDALKQIKQP
jgi:hypothetical protein